MTYPMTIAGIKRELPLCKVADDFYIGAFIMFGDAEITVACAKELLARAPKEYDYLLTAEAKSIPLIHEMARQSGASEYFVARKGMKVYLTDPIHVQVRSITTQHDQDLYLSGADAAKMRGKKILIVDDVISTGESLHALEELVHQAGGEVAGRMAVLAEGDAQKREDIVYLEKLPVFNADGTVKG
ncbi:MAG: adenine phosphoribosyltransferase [Clostridiales bacterium]|nr:adenine phosphoribosyltransferase [Clostridiales bacterium]MDD6063231.1 phosphoribosyltransferase family protein [Clostridiales bacterium]